MNFLLALILSTGSAAELETQRGLIARMVESGQTDLNDDQMDLLAIAISQHRGNLVGAAA